MNSTTTISVPEPLWLHDSPQRSGSLTSDLLIYPDAEGIGRPQLHLQSNQDIDPLLPSRDELSQFLNGSVFEQITAPRILNINNSPLTSAGQFRLMNALSGYTPVTGEGARATQSNSCLSAPQTASLTMLVDNTRDGNTDVQHGQFSPGDSSISSGKSVGKGVAKTDNIYAQPRRGGNAGKSQRDSSAEKPTKKTKKPRKSTGRKLTPEQELERREIHLKRNREAAHRCRNKKKHENEEIARKVEVLDADNSRKSFQVAKLKREIEALKALLLPHYRECNDEQLVTYMDTTTLGPPQCLMDEITILKELRSLVADTTPSFQNTNDEIKYSTLSTWASALLDVDGKYTPSASSTSQDLPGNISLESTLKT